MTTHRSHSAASKRQVAEEFIETEQGDVVAAIGVGFERHDKPSFMVALTKELQKPGAALDALLRPHVQIGALPTAQTAEVLKTVFGLNKSGSSPSM